MDLVTDSSAPSGTVIKGSSTFGEGLDGSEETACDFFSVDLGAFEFSVAAVQEDREPAREAVDVVLLLVIVEETSDEETPLTEGRVLENLRLKRCSSIK